MSLRLYLIIVSICTVLCWAAFITVLATINPDTTGILGFAFFYVSLLLALIGTFSLLGFVGRYLLKKDFILYKQINLASRQAIMIALLFLIVLLLQSQRVLFWWNMGLLVAIFALIELFFLSFRKNIK